MKTSFKFILVAWLAIWGQAMAATCTSKASGNWNSTSTWTCTSGSSTPGSNDTVVLASPYTVSLNGNDRTIASITINSGATLNNDGKDLTVNGNLTNNGTLSFSDGDIKITGNFTNAGTLSFGGNKNIEISGNFVNNGTLSLGIGDFKINGNFTNAGTFNAGTGKVEFKGNAAQTITGNVTFYDLKVDNGSSNGLTLAGNVVVANTPTGNAETGGLVKLTSTCPTDYTLTSNGGATVQHSCAGGGATAPTATTNAATSITATGATLNGTVSSNGASTTVTFDYGLTTGYGSSATASASPLASGASSSAVSAAITGLTCGGTTYHFRVKAVNSAGTTNGSDLTFTTAVCSVPAVTSINRADFNPAKAGSNVSWTVIFNTSVTGVDTADFALIQAGGASITSVSGSGTTWTVTVSTTTATAGTLGLNLVDNDSINSGGVVLAGVGVNGNFTGQTYTVIASPCSSPLASDILFCDDFERTNSGTLGNGWTVTPTSATNCTGAAGNTGCSGIDSDIPPFNTFTSPRANPSRSMFTRWAPVSVDSPVVNLAGRAGAQLSFWMRRGRDTFSECPEAAGENYLVQYYASDLTWKILAQYPSSPSAALCDGQIFTPVIELPPDALHAAFKMRFYQPSGSGRSGSGGAPGVVGYDYWHMDDVIIRATTGPSYVGAFCDNFEAGSRRWSITAEGFSSGNIGDASIGTKAFQSAGHELDLRWGYVTASTFKTNLTGVSGNITYWVRSGTTAALDPVTNENLVVEYLNSANVWTTLNTYLGSVASGTAYSASYAIPADAKHANFRLRFRKVSGGGYDKSYWHVDDVCVGNPSTSDLSLTMNGDSTLVPGTTTNYTLRVTNNGPDVFSGSIQVIDTLPSGLTYVSGGGGTSGWTCAAPGQTVTCDWSGLPLANGASAPNLVITAAVGAGVTGNITNTAVLTGSGTDPNTGNNTASFESGNFIPYFIFTDGTCVDGIKISGAGQTCAETIWTSMVAGQSKTGIYITAVTKADVDGDGILDKIPTKLSSSASTTVSTQFGLTCHDPVANAGVKATFTAVAAALPLCTGNGADPTTWSTATSLTFAAGATSVATAYSFTYADVGRIELFMRNSVATSQVGRSTAFVVKPAGLVFTEIKPTDTTVSGRCALPATACANAATDAMTFVRAGEAFTATVKAIATSGAAAPNFGKETKPASVDLIPENVVADMISAPGVEGAFGTFSGGIGTGVDFKWGEVGIITLEPQVADYLGAGKVLGTISGNVGRFYPDHFDTVIDQLSGVPMPCPDLLCPTTFNGIVYSGQPFSVTVTANNANGDPTANYNTTTKFAKTTTLTPYGALGAATAVSGAGTLGVASVTAFSAGTLTEASEKYTFTIPITIPPTTPTPTNIYINASDGEASSRRTSNPTTTSVEGGVRVVSGRINIPNMYGSERLKLPLTATVQYYNGTYWVTSLTDSVTSFNTNLSTVVGGNLDATIKNGLGSGITVISPSAAAVVAGVRTFILAAPLVFGSVELSLNAPAYLPNVAARATFGVFKSPIIYRRENY